MRRRRLRVSLSLAIVLALAAPLLLACNGDEDASADGDGGGSGEETPAATVDDGREGGPEPSLEGPASQYAALLDEVGSGYFAERRSTFNLDVESYAAVSLFPSAEEGASLLEEWGYAGGYQTGFEPERREVDVLNGKFYSSVEVHLFESNEGAQEFYDYAAERLNTAGAEQVSVAGIGNASGGWARLDENPVPGSDVGAVLHWYMFRRGNLVASVRTYGAQTLMTIDHARDLAVIIDEKALGDREAVEPTPIVLDTEGTATPAP